ncbi:hypothetical protein NJL88_08990 [Streptomyces sp. DK15]|uniref:recombination directionality factor n=1 Tax=Streptomyces sp. DK15 TaxID=2957499 RepID=UPI0029AB014D|nr:hypothetical protein [Streptomyces sp. DK15]MDX2390199.1 hypothetical protein [Streptomyces sp. DK15]
MALKIWDTDPNNKPKPRQTFSDDTVGRFHSGRAVDGQPEALSEWRISTGDPEVAKAVAQLYGGEPIENEESTSENYIDVFTEQESILVVLDGPSAIYSDLKLWNRNKLVHHCDGVSYLSPDERKGSACGCPEIFAERKQAAKDYMGPSPSITVTFRLADDYDLGKFKFQSGSWGMAEVLHEYDNALSRVKGEALCELTLELVEFTIKKGKNKGLAVSYYKPVIKVLKSYNAAIADAE